MAVTDFIVAIELGSTKITGVAGKKNADGSIQILAYASEKSSDCIKKGAICNLDKTTQLITTVISQLEEMLQASIKKVYVGLGGQSAKILNCLLPLNSRTTLLVSLFPPQPIIPVRKTHAASAVSINLLNFFFICPSLLKRKYVFYLINYIIFEYFVQPAQWT